MKKRKGGFDTFSLSDYLITEDGKVINLKWNREVKPQPNGKGYLRVHIAGKMYFVHRLVAEKYVPNPENKPQVNHKDGDKKNNNSSNLEWVTNRENRLHAVKKGFHIQGEKCPWAKLTAKSVKYIRDNPDINRRELAAKFGVSEITITDVLKRKSWKSI